MLNWLLERFKEPSTWRGLGGMLVAAGLASAGTVDLIAVAGVAIVSIVETMRAERVKKSVAD